LQKPNADVRELAAVGADFHGAGLAGADLRGADLRGADLGGAVLAGVKYDRETGWPVGFEPGAHGARMEE